MEARTRQLREANQQLLVTERELRKSETRFKAAAHATADVILEIDLVSRVLTWFGDVDAQLGYDPGQAPRCVDLMRDHLHPDDRARVTDAITRAFAAGETYHLECRVRCRDGSYQHWESRGRVTATENGRPRLAIASQRDITERKRAENERDTMARTRREMQHTLRELTTRLFTAQEDERRRLALEFHDGFVQQIAAVSIHLGSLRQGYPELPPEVCRQLLTIQNQIVELADELRRVSHELHPAALEQLGLEAALRAHCESLALHQGIILEFESRGCPAQLPRDIAICIFRIAQTALRNVIRHSGARTGSVALRGTTEPDTEEDGLELVVVDDGVGFDVSEAKRKGGLGLVGMEERLRPLGGRVRIMSASGMGTQVRAFAPVPRGGEG